MMRDLVLEPSRVGRSLVVSASAGSGKTFTLTALVLGTLGRGALRPHEVLATTFSEAAAADLRGRLLRPLDLLAGLEPSDWAALLPLREEADAFARALEALDLPEGCRGARAEVAAARGLWPGSEGWPAWAAAPREAWAFWRRTRREAESLRVGTLHGLALALLRTGGQAPRALCPAEHPRLLRPLRQAFRATLDLPPEHPDHPAAALLLPWVETHWEAVSRLADAHRDALGRLETPDTAPLRAAVEDALGALEPAFAPFSEDPARALNPDSRQKRYFKPEKLLRRPGPEAPLIQRLRWAEAQSRALFGSSAEDGLKGYYSEALREAAEAFPPLAEALEGWLEALVMRGLGAFEALKAERGLATFGDLVTRALQGLEDGSLTPPRPGLLVVDEFQDTSPAQDRFLERLGARTTVVVGDLKQAIYGFRSGDPGLLRRRLAEAGPDACRLPANHRSARPVVDLANAFVDRVWPRLDPGAGDLDGRQEARREGPWPVGFARLEATGRGTDLPALAPWVAALGSEAGWTAALGAPRQPIRRRRALLLKQRTRLPRLLQGLKARGLAPYVIAQDGFWESPGVRLLMAALEAAAHPDRPLPLAALLRQVAGLADGDLDRLLEAPEGSHPRLPGLATLDPDRAPEALRPRVAWLQAILHSKGTQALAGELLADGRLLDLLAATEAHGPLEPLRARRNLSGFLDLLLDLPDSPAAAFATLEELRAGLERGDLPADPEGADLIVQTGHASKGLEYEDVILPLLDWKPRAVLRGEARTDPDGRLRFAWKLGAHAGPAHRALKARVETEARRDSLNLLYVALTRARERMVVLCVPPAKPSEAPEASRTWGEWGLHLAAQAEDLALLAEPPAFVAPPRPAAVPLAAPPARSPLAPPTDEGPASDLPEADRSRRRREGEQMHAFVRDLLVRWEDPAAFAACLERAPALPQTTRSAREQALGALAALEAQGWRPLRRRTELPLAGAAASGAEGRADLVIWAEDTLHVIDFKHAEGFGPGELEIYRAQLQRYAAALGAPAVPVRTWLLALKTGALTPL